MLYTYFFIFSPQFGDQDEIQEFIDALPEIVNWQRHFDQSFLIVSALMARDLAAIFKAARPKARFLLLDTDTDRDGWMPKVAWDLMRRPKPPVD